MGVHWESQESNLPLPLVCITGYQCSGCRPGIQESNVYIAAQTRTCTQLLGRQTFRSQSAHYILHSTSNKKKKHLRAIFG